MEDDFLRFLQAGGKIGLSDWKQLTDQEKNTMMQWNITFSSFIMLQAKFLLAKNTTEKLAVAEEMREFDNGVLAQSLRIQINKAALEMENLNVDKTNNATTGIQGESAAVEPSPF